MNTASRKQILTFGIYVILLAQLNVDIFTSNFRVSLGILLLPVLIYLYHEIPVMPIALVSGVGVFVSRVFIQSLRYGFAVGDIPAFFPEFVFYLVYGLLLSGYFRRKEFKMPHPHCYIPLFVMDYLANLSELLCRLGAGAFSLPLQINILLVALLRTVILWAVITGLSQYRFLLVSAEHANRYQRLILLISKLNSEVIWMHKNTAMIEDAMAKSYQLFSRLQEAQVDPELSQSALTVAKDIHEVKKEYLMILRGISEALDLNLHDGDMSLSDILTVLQNSLTLLATQQGKKLTMEIQMETNLKTDKHYFLLSVFRNLFTNALEASTGEHVQLGFTESQQGDLIQFAIRDNGPGIPPEILPSIFQPGFSTKINFSTGEVNRGLGLNLVEDVVKNQLQGDIRVESRPGCTTFYIQVPKTQLEVAPQ